MDWGMRMPGAVGSTWSRSRIRSSGTAGQSLLFSCSEPDAMHNTMGSFRRLVARKNARALCGPSTGRRRMDYGHFVPVKRRRDRLEAAKFAASACSETTVRGTGVAGGPGVFLRSAGRKQKAAGLEFARGQTAPMSGGCEPRGRSYAAFFQAIGGDPCFDEHVAFDMGGNGLRIARWCLGLTFVVEVIRPEALQRHMRSPGVVPALEFCAEGDEVVKPLDERHASQPFVLERLDNALRYGDGSALSHGSETRFDVPLTQQRREDIADKDFGLIGDDVFRRPMLLHGLLQGLDGPAGVGAFQRSDAHDLAREVVDSHQDLDGPQAPAQDFRGVDRPDVIGIPGGNRARFRLFLWLVGRGWRGTSIPRFRPLQDVSHRRGREEDTQQFELVGDANPSPAEVGFCDFPDERGRSRLGSCWRGPRQASGLRSCVASDRAWIGRSRNTRRPFAWGSERLRCAKG